MGKLKTLTAFLVGIVLVTVGFALNTFSATTPPQASDGYYELDSYEDLVWFQQYVDAGNLEINARLTADIVANENLLNDIEVRLNVDFLEEKEKYSKEAKCVVFTGPIDAYFNYCLGALEYRSVKFETEVLDTSNYQGNAAVNYTDYETPWTRIIEHKWFEFGKDEMGNDLPKTVISKEYSSEWTLGDEPYYPVNDEKNSILYKEYKKLADVEKKVVFGGRLGEYKYYDMDQTIDAALKLAENIIS